MLVVTRKTGQRILVGDSITITLVLAIDGRARIGIEAPEDVVVLREELVRQVDHKPRKHPKPLNHRRRPKP